MVYYFRMEEHNRCIIAGLAISVVLYVRVIPVLLKEDKLEKYTGQTTGIVNTVEENIGMKQDEEGTKIYNSYTVTYSYQIGGIIYTGTEIFKLSPETNGFIQTITNSHGEPLVIRYDEAEPTKSTILIN